MNDATNAVPPVLSLTAPVTPIFIRLPRAGEACAWTGLSRSAMNALVLPSATNNWRAPVASRVLRGRGKLKGVRLILFESLIDHLRACPDGSVRPEADLSRATR